MNIRLTHIGTATLLLEIGSLRLLTDPVFDPAGGHYFFGYGAHSIKLTEPAIAPNRVCKLITSVIARSEATKQSLFRA